MNQEYSDKSRSQKKRESTAMQNLGEQLASLPPSALASLELPEPLLVALRDWHKVKTHEARRRQMQYVGRVMREEGDEAAIRERLDAMLAPGREENAALHQVENLRDTLLSATEPELAALLQDMAAQHPNLEAPKLRHLITQAKLERANKKSLKTYRELFRYLKALSPPV